jgi:long-chain acyl-CoA synthetase
MMAIMTNDKPWLTQYPEDVPTKIDSSMYNNINDLFKEPFNTHAKKAAYINMGHSLSYQDLESKSNAFAAYLQSESP